MVTAGGTYLGLGSDSNEVPLVKCRLGLAGPGETATGGQPDAFTIANGDLTSEDISNIPGFGGLFDLIGGGPGFSGVAHDELTTTLQVPAGGDSARLSCVQNGGDSVDVADIYIRAIKIG